MTDLEKLQSLARILMNPPPAASIPVELRPAAAGLLAAWQALTPARRKAILVAAFCSHLSPEQLAKLQAAWALSRFQE